MDKEICIGRVNEIMELIKAKVENEASRLYSCGAIDMDQYKSDEGYRLPSVLVAAALRNVEYMYKQVSLKDIKTLRNLEKF